MSQTETKFGIWSIPADIDQFGFLYVVNESHIDMTHMYDLVRQIIRANQPGPQLYLQPIYTYYSSVLSDRIKLMTESIFEQNAIPVLPVSLALSKIVGKHKCFAMQYRFLSLIWICPMITELST